MSDPTAPAPGSRPAVVLLHASASSSRQWQGLAQALQPAFDVRCIDLHGHGTQGPWPAGSPMRLADDAALALQHLAAAGHVHLVGHSYGAAVALKLACLHPQRVLSVSVYEPVLFRWLLDPADDDGSAQAVLAVAQAVSQRLAAGDAWAAAETFIDFWSGQGAWTALPPGRQHDIASRMAAVRLHFEALFNEPPQRTQLARLTVPMQVITGSATVPALQRLAQLWRRDLPRVRHVSLVDAGHMGPVTHADAFNAQVQAFLRRATAPAAGRPLAALPD